MEKRIITPSIYISSISKLDEITKSLENISSKIINTIAAATMEFSGTAMDDYIKKLTLQNNNINETIVLLENYKVMNQEILNLVSTRIYHNPNSALTIQNHERQKDIQNIPVSFSAKFDAILQSLETGSILGRDKSYYESLLYGCYRSNYVTEEEYAADFTRHENNLIAVNEGIRKVNNVRTNMDYCLTSINRSCELLSDSIGNIHTVQYNDINNPPEKFLVNLDVVKTSIDTLVTSGGILLDVKLLEFPKMEYYKNKKNGKYSIKYLNNDKGITDIAKKSTVRTSNVFGSNIKNKTVNSGKNLFVYGKAIDKVGGAVGYLVDGVIVYDAFTNDIPNDEGAAVGGVAGGIAGGIAGAKFGAFVGSIIPGLGTVGGIIVGAMAGYAISIIGSSFGKKIGDGVQNGF